MNRVSNNNLLLPQNMPGNDSNGYNEDETTLDNQQEPGMRKSKRNKEIPDYGVGLFRKKKNIPSSALKESSHSSSSSRPSSSPKESARPSSSPKQPQIVPVGFKSLASYGDEIAVQHEQKQQSSSSSSSSSKPQKINSEAEDAENDDHNDEDDALFSYENDILARHGSPRPLQSSEGGGGGGGGFLSDALFDQIMADPAATGEYRRTTRPEVDEARTENFLGASMVQRMRGVASTEHLRRVFQQVEEDEVRAQRHQLKIGEGAYGDVRPLRGHDGRAVIKTAPLYPGKGIPADIVREINAYTSVEHPNVMSLEGVHLELLHPSQREYEEEEQRPAAAAAAASSSSRRTRVRGKGKDDDGEDEEDDDDDDDDDGDKDGAPVIGLVLPLANGSDLGRFLTESDISKGLLDNEHVVRALLFQMLSGVAALHSHQIVHRDLKPANFLVHTRRRLSRQSAPLIDAIAAARKSEQEKALDRVVLVQVGDLGLSTTLDGPLSGVSEEGRFYTTWYRPPEHWISGQAYDTGSDIWALACTFFELATATMEPLTHANTRAQFEAFCREAFGRPSPSSFSLQRPGDTSKFASSLSTYIFKRLGAYDPLDGDTKQQKARKRRHPWYHWSAAFRLWFMTLLVGMLDFTCSKRLSAQGVIDGNFDKPKARSSSSSSSSWPQPNRFEWYENTELRPPFRRQQVEWTTYVKNLSYASHVAKTGGVSAMSASAIETRVFDSALQFGLQVAYGMDVTVNTWLLFVLLVERTVMPFLADKRFSMVARGKVATKGRRGGGGVDETDEGANSIQRWALSCLRIAARIKEVSYKTLGRQGASEEDVSLRAKFKLPQLAGFTRTRAHPLDPMQAWFRAMDDAWLLERLGGQVTLFDRWDKCGNGAEVQALFLMSFQRHALISHLVEVQSGLAVDGEEQVPSASESESMRKQLRKYFGVAARSERIKCTSTIKQLFTSAPRSSSLAHIIPDGEKIAAPVTMAAGKVDLSVHIGSLARFLGHIADEDDDEEED